MKTHQLLFFLAISACMTLSAAFAQADESGWLLAQEDQGIQIFRRPQGEGAVDEVKGMLVITGDIDSAFTVMSNLAKLSETDPVVVESEILQTVNENEYYIWQRAKMPFFMSDRDIVSKITFSRTSKGGYMLVAHTYPDFIPERPRLVRMQDLSLVIALRPVSTTSFELLYKLSVRDTYGAVVTNASNKAVLESTMERMRRLRDLTVTRPIAADK